jgi:RNA polymerase sigma factor (sigma-70 family)
VNSLTDQQLLRDYTSDRSEVAFAELVQRHVDLVYSAALRMVCDSHLAEDVTQGVFVALAKNATQLMDRPVLSGWLHRTAQNIAAQTVRTDVRRRAREQEAAAMNELLVAEPDANWEHIAPHLDAALGELSEPDRDALLLRYFERKSAREMAQTLGISDEAAQKRVSRAVERLREFFAKHGVTVGTSGLVVVISANAVQAAPVSLAVTISAAAALTGTTIATIATATAVKTIAMTTLQKTIVTATIAAAVGAGIYEAHQASVLKAQVQNLQQQQAPLAEQNQQLQNERDTTTNRLASMAEEMANTKGNNEELLKLRGEVGVLKRQASEASQRARIAEENLATELSSKAQFAKHETATINATKQLCLAVRVFSADHENQYPTNIVQLADELGGSFAIGGIDLGVFEFINIGAERLDHPNMVELRERLARQVPDGTWRRIYGFADGSVQTATSNNGNFEGWEKANTYLPPPNQNQ